jgi:cytolysin (calcineurin-like family phosphatase)
MPLYKKLIAGLVGLALGSAIYRLSHAEKPHGYTTEYGDFVSDTCEHTLQDGTQFKDGTERFLISTGPTHEAVCIHQGYVTETDCKARDAQWEGPLTTLDYSKNEHRVCVINMPPGKITRCFDLYDIGER